MCLPREGERHLSTGETLGERLLRKGETLGERDLRKGETLGERDLRKGEGETFARLLHMRGGDTHNRTQSYSLSLSPLPPLGHTQMAVLPFSQQHKASSSTCSWASGGQRSASLLSCNSPPAGLRV